MSDSSALGSKLSSQYDSTLGALVIGVLISMSLWGITCVQTFEYFMDCKGDRLRQKLVVAALCAIDTFSSAVNALTVYNYTITNYANPSVIVTATWGITSTLLVTGISNCIVRTMYSLQIYKLSGKNKLLVLWISMLQICDIVVVIIASVRLFRAQEIARISYLSFAFGIACDISVATSLCWLLYASRTGLGRGAHIVNVFMVYVIHTSLIVPIDAMVVLITFIVLPGTMIPDAFFMLLGKLYINCYLARLKSVGRVDKESRTSALSRLDFSSYKGRQSQSGATTTDYEPGTSSNPTTAIKFRTSVEEIVEVEEDMLKSHPQVD